MNPLSPNQRLTSIALALLVLLLLATACGRSDAASSSDPSPSPTDAPDSTPESDPTPTPEHPAEDDEVVFSVFTTGGFVPVEIALAEFPELVVLADGTVYQPGAQITIFPPPLVPALERLQLDESQVDEIRAAIAESDAMNPSADFGQSNVTDLPTTYVTAVVDGKSREVGVYALGVDGGITGEALENRQAVSDLITTVQAIVNEAIPTGEISDPPALAVLTFPTLVADEAAGVRVWPIATLPEVDPDGRGCVIVEGEEMQTLLDAAADANTQTAWQLGDQVQAVILRPVFPHEEIC